jgi:hypothetical protein
MLISYLVVNFWTSKKGVWLVLVKIADFIFDDHDLSLFKGRAAPADR